MRCLARPSTPMKGLLAIRQWSILVTALILDTTISSDDTTFVINSLKNEAGFCPPSVGGYNYTPSGGVTTFKGPGDPDQALTWLGIFGVQGPDRNNIQVYLTNLPSRPESALTPGERPPAVESACHTESIRCQVCWQDPLHASGTDAIGIYPNPGDGNDYHPTGIVTVMRGGLGPGAAFSFQQDDLNFVKIK